MRLIHIHELWLFLFPRTMRWRVTKTDQLLAVESRISLLTCILTENYPLVIE